MTFGFPPLALHRPLRAARRSPVADGRPLAFALKRAVVRGDSNALSRRLPITFCSTLRMCVFENPCVSFIRFVLVHPHTTPPPAPLPLP